jgi:hypothetical protein
LPSGGLINPALKHKDLLVRQTPIAGERVCLRLRLPRRHERPLRGRRNLARMLLTSSPSAG